MAIWRSRTWLLLAFAVGASAGVGYAKFVVPAVYGSTFLVRYDGFSELPGVPQPAETGVAELEQAFLTPDVLRAVRKERGIDKPLKVVRTLIKTSSNAETETVAVYARGKTPEGAQAFADALYDQAMAFRERQRERVIRAAEERVNFRIEAHRKEADKVRSAYNAFREQHGIEGLSPETREGMRGSADLQAQRDLIGAEVAALEARVTQLKKDVRASPELEVAGTASTSPEHERLAQLQGELGQARGSLSDDHPRVRSLELQVATLRRRISSGDTARVSSSSMRASTARVTAQTSLAQAQADLEAARERMVSLGRLVDDSEVKAKRFSQVEGEAVELMTQVKVAETMLANLQEEKAQLHNALRRVETGMSKINPAELPEQAEPNESRLKIAAGVPAGLLVLVLAMVVLREFWGARLMTPSEIGYWGRGPVLAVSTWPRDPTALDELVADFDDCARYPAGETLMVGATEPVLEHTGLLARRLHEEWFENSVVVEAREPARLPRTRALASGAGEPVRGATLELWSHQPKRDEEPRQAAGATSSLARSTGRGRVLAWSGGMEGHALRRAARLADRVVVVVEAGRMNPLSVQRLRAAIARQDGVGYILVSAPAAVAEGRDRVGPVHEFWQIAPE